MAKGLKTLQSQFLEAVVQESDELPEAFIAEINPGGRLTAEAAARVYREGYHARLTEALGETFETIWWVLGDEDFVEACRSYIKTTPSLSYNLSDYGETFPSFLGLRFEGEYPFLPSLAEFEWAVKNLFHFPDPETDLEEVFAALEAGEDLVFEFVPQMTVFRSPFAVFEFYKHRQSHADEAPEFEWERSCTYLLYKQKNQVSVAEFNEAEAFILDHLCVGESLYQVLTKVESRYPEFDENCVSRFFQRVYGMGIISGRKA